jgi:hypothetical protein
VFHNDVFRLYHGVFHRLGPFNHDLVTCFGRFVAESTDPLRSRKQKLTFNSPVIEAIRAASASLRKTLGPDISAQRCGRQMRKINPPARAENRVDRAYPRSSLCVDLHRP